MSPLEKLIQELVIETDLPKESFDDFFLEIPLEELCGTIEYLCSAFLFSPVCSL